MNGLFFVGVALLVFFNNVVSSEYSGCPSDEWKQLSCSCYFFASSNKVLNWNRANESCSIDKKWSHLATIHSQNENDFVGRYIKNESWIGLRREANSTFEWVNGEKRVWSQTKNSSSSKPECVAVKSTGHGTWIAQSCSLRHRFICEKKTINNTCPKSKAWRKLKNMCYVLLQTQTNLTDSRNPCSTVNASLAEISTKEQLEFFKEMFNSENEIIWFGLKRLHNATKFRYITSKTEPNYAAIGVDVKDSDSKGERCVGLKVATDEARWVRKPCDEMRNYVCETEANRDFNFTRTNVNETSANISWRLSQSTCNKMSPDANYELLLIITNSSSAKQSFKIDNPKTRSQVFTDLEPATSYTVIMIETLKASGRSRKSAYIFTTSEITNPLTLLSNISSDSIEVNLKKKVSLLCSAIGEPPIQFRWEKDNIAIESFTELQKPFPSSLLLVDLKDNNGFGKYTCHIEDRFNRTSHEILVEAFSKDDDSEKEQFMIATIILATLLLILLVIAGYLVHRTTQKKKGKVRISLKKSDNRETNLKPPVAPKPKDTEKTQPGSGQFEMYANLSDNRKNNGAEESETDTAFYTSLNRPDVETNEDDFYTHLKDDDDAVYENTRDIGV